MQKLAKIIINQSLNRRPEKNSKDNRPSRFFTFSMCSLALAVLMVATSAISASSRQPRMIDGSQQGTCRSGRIKERTICFFPSVTWTYGNALAIEYKGGSGADVYWYTAVEIQGASISGKVTGGIEVGVVNAGAEVNFADNGKRLRTLSQKCIIGGSQHNQQPYCQNPFRGSPVVIRVVPHNTNWQTDFVVHRDPEIR
ncbi:hypothetical protein [Microcoleus sp.]|uniref:hypothetical protein n=1 Tax=Microcoleus sp. TaxID=44472 RepID=UPI003C745384